MTNLTEKYLKIVKEKNPGETEFQQAVEEVLVSLEPVIAKHPEYEKAGLVERLVEPERMISFRVSWVDDSGQVQVNRGYRCQFNSALGPYKGGLRFAPNVNPSVMKFLAFEQNFKNALTGLPIGGGKGGADFDPNGKSDGEIMRFCQAYMNELYRHIGPYTDSPAGDIGVGPREIGYLFGQYKKLVNRFDEAITGKHINYGGLNGRTEATGYGIVYFADCMLKANNETMKGKKVVISGFGNVAWGTAKKLEELGAIVIAFSGPDGYILDEAGVLGEKIDYMTDLRNSGKNICQPYADKFAGSKFVAGKKPWEVKADLYIPCAMQNDIHLEDAKNIVASGAKFLCEGANMPTTNEALEYLVENGVIVGPCKAANAGGVACSCIEMGQNAGHTVFSPDQVHEQLKTIMISIHDSAAAAAEEYGLGYNLIAGANIAGFMKIANAMMAQGVV
ncbi:MAG: NADP-specific glutamate dehydrogenase [Anaerovoracaceae bacterium]|jgi:glutamate dehydrogenase (NADP+)